VEHHRVADAEGRVAAELVRVFSEGRDIFVRLSAGVWMWEYLWPKTNETGRTVLIDSAVAGVVDTNPDISRFSLEQLLSLNGQVPIRHKNAAVAESLRNRLRDASPSERPGLAALIARLSP
jgi:hypothetical protein